MANNSDIIDLVSSSPEPASSLKLSFSRMPKAAVSRLTGNSETATDVALNLTEKLDLAGNTRATALAAAHQPAGMAGTSAAVLLSPRPARKVGDKARASVRSPQPIKGDSKRANVLSPTGKMDFGVMFEQAAKLNEMGGVEAAAAAKAARSRKLWTMDSTTAVMSYLKECLQNNSKPTYAKAAALVSLPTTAIKQAIENDESLLVAWTNAVDKAAADKDNTKEKPKKGKKSKEPLMMVDKELLLGLSPTLDVVKYCNIYRHVFVCGCGAALDVRPASPEAWKWGARYAFPYYLVCCGNTDNKRVHTYNLADLKDKVQSARATFNV